MQDRRYPPVPFPLPAGPGTGHVSPPRIADALVRLLAQHGVGGTYAAACDLYAVISVTAGLTIWTNGRLLWWNQAGQLHTWPAADTTAAAARIAALAGRRDGGMAG